MPSGSPTFSYNYRLTTTSTPGQYTVSTKATQAITLVDVSDGAGDDLWIFGDVANDGIRIGTGTTPNLNFVGNSSISGDIIVRNYNSQSYYLVTNNANVGNGTTVTDAGGTYVVTCYASGTGILTSQGNELVEHLAVGDLVVTASGEHRPIKWIGTMKVSFTNDGIREFLPIRFRAGSLGEGLPQRDLLVSPYHAFYREGVLIEAKNLLTEGTIEQVPVETITYWHIELDSHDVLLAEGVPAESYLDCGNRHAFDNADPTLPPPLKKPWNADDYAFCAPLTFSGEIVEKVRAELRERAAALARDTGTAHGLPRAA